MPCRTARAAAAAALHCDSHCCDMTLQSTFRLAIARQAQARLPACRLASACNVAGQLRHSAGKQAIASHPRTPLDSMATVVWLKRDLRLADNAPLAAAAASGQPTVVLYCYEPSVVHATDFSHCHLQVCSIGQAVTHFLALLGSHTLTTLAAAALPTLLTSPQLLQFINESLAEVDGALQKLGGSLVVRHGEVTEVLTALSAELAPAGGIARLVSHEETGTPATIARNAAVAQWAQQKGVEWRELPQTGVALGGCVVAGASGLVAWRGCGLMLVKKHS